MAKKKQNTTPTSVNAPFPKTILVHRAYEGTADEYLVVTKDPRDIESDVKRVAEYALVSTGQIETTFVPLE